MVTTTDIIRRVAGSLPASQGWTLLDAGAGQVRVISPHRHSRNVDVEGLNETDAEARIWQTINLLSRQ